MTWQGDLAGGVVLLQASEARSGYKRPPRALQHDLPPRAEQVAVLGLAHLELHEEELVPQLSEAERTAAVAAVAARPLPQGPEAECDGRVATAELLLQEIILVEAVCTTTAAPGSQAAGDGAEDCAGCDDASAGTAAVDGVPEYVAAAHVDAAPGVEVLADPRPEFREPEPDLEAQDLWQYHTNLVAILSSPGVFDELESHPSLADWLLTLPSMLEMAELLTREPPLQALPAYRQAAFVAAALIDGCGRPRPAPNSPLLALSDRLCKAFMLRTEDGAGPLERLWEFATHSTAEEVDSALAGYFARVARLLAERHPDEVAYRLRSRGLAVRQGLVERLYSEPLAELLLTSCRSTRQSPAPLSTLPTDGLVDALVEVLREEGEDGLRREAARRILDGLLDQVQSSSFNADLLDQFTDPAITDTLMGTLLSGDASAATAGAVVARAVSVLYGGMPQIALAAATAVSARRRRAVGLLSDDEGEEAAEALEHIARMGEKVRACIQDQVNGMLAQVCKHLPGLANLIRDLLGQSRLLALPLGTVRVAGPCAREIVALVTALVQTCQTSVLDALTEANIVPLCIELMFAFPWNNLVHNGVLRLVRTVLEAGSGLLLGLLRHPSFGREGSVPGDEAAAALLPLGPRLVLEFDAEDKHRKRVSRARAERVGYMGHLHILTKELSEFCENVPECGAELFNTDGWFSIVIPFVRQIDRIHCAGLGAPRHPPAPTAAAAEVLERRAGVAPLVARLYEAPPRPRPGASSSPPPLGPPPRPPPPPAEDADRPRGSVPETPPQPPQPRGLCPPWGAEGPGDGGGGSSSSRSCCRLECGGSRGEADLPEEEVVTVAAPAGPDFGPPRRLAPDAAPEPPPPPPPGAQPPSDLPHGGASAWQRGFAISATARAIVAAGDCKRAQELLRGSAEVAAEAAHGGREALGEAPPPPPGPEPPQSGEHFEVAGHGAEGADDCEESEHWISGFSGVQVSWAITEARVPEAFAAEPPEVDEEEDAHRAAAEGLVAATLAGFAGAAACRAEAWQWQELASDAGAAGGAAVGDEDADSETYIEGLDLPPGFDAPWTPPGFDVQRPALCTGRRVVGEPAHPAGDIREHCSSVMMHLPAVGGC